MWRVSTYSLLIILGIAISQVFDLTSIRSILNFLIITVLGYIMIEVGLELTLEKGKLKSYGKDFLIASAATAIPWILCSLYFLVFFDIDLTKATIVGRFAAASSAGVIFTMLAAAGLASTWMFKKARILAIFDDLDTILLIVPLQLIRLGMDWRAFFLVAIFIVLLIVAYRYLHTIRLPTSRGWLLCYALLLTILTESFEKTTLINVEIILPAFVLGCIIVNPHDPKKTTIHRHEHAFIEPEKHRDRIYDNMIKCSYMLLVGCSLPKISWGLSALSFLALHVFMLTFLSNLGKLYPMLCYKQDASLRERIALSVAMWPRGEVGAGILIISMSYALPPVVLQLAELSVAINLTLTGLFIYLVLWILNKPRRLNNSL